MLELNSIYNIDCDIGLDQIDYCDVLITDIPYNISKSVHTETIKRRLDYGDWDKQTNDNIYKRLYKAVDKTKNAFYIFCSDFQFSYIYEKLKADDWLIRCLVWLKPNPTVINCDKLYAPSQELIIYGKRRGGLYNPKYKKSYFTYTAPTGKKRVHPNQKPLELIEEFINDSSHEGDIICDPFAGSGTVLIAANKLHRKFIGFENEEQYYNLILERLNYNI